MRILIVSYFFPPYNIIGAVRVGKLAKYLDRFGHDVRVIAASGLPLGQTLRVEIARERVTYTPWRDVDRPYRVLLQLRSRVRGATARNVSRATAQPVAAADSRLLASEGTKLTDRIRRLYTDLVHVPDAAAGWRTFAVRAGLDMVREWRPDVILASAAPWTSLLVASELSKRTNIPWVADFRDLWVDNPDLPRSGWRARTIDTLLERRIITSAAALVTVSEPLADKLRRRYPEKRVHVVLNGFDSEDYPRSRGVPAMRSDRERNGQSCLRLVYTGQINRDLLPLWDALALLGADAASICIDMVGVSNEAVKQRYLALAEQRGISESIRWLPAVPHAEAAALQQSADVLFALVHDSPNDACIYTGKLFEYIGARRPVLIVGTSRGVAAELVRSRQLGAAAGTPDAIARQLRAWLNEKRQTGVVALPIGASTEDLSREAQARAFVEVLREATADNAANPGRDRPRAVAHHSMAGDQR